MMGRPGDRVGIRGGDLKRFIFFGWPTVCLEVLRDHMVDGGVRRAATTPPATLGGLAFVTINF